MISTIKSATIIGIDAREITVEVDAKKGLPMENIVGLPDAVIRESRSRIRAAILNSGFQYPVRQYTINLAPAELHKEGSIFDLPIALGLLTVTEQVTLNSDAFFVGELSLTGQVKGIRGILSICEYCTQHHIKKIILPYENVAEASLIQGIEIIPIKQLNDLQQLSTLAPYKSPTKWTHIKSTRKDIIDYSDVQGQHFAKKAIEICAAGNHNLLFVGPPGSGKSMLLKRLPTIMPDLTQQEAIETYKIHSISNRHSGNREFSFQRPFRSPHHSISYVGMIGGGTKPSPGEISMAHHGILFLDELPEFPRQVLEVLRQPLEDQCITISRSQFQIDYPAKFILVAAMNPCPCGYHGDPLNSCQCSPNQIDKYKKKISGPILDRFDMIVDVPRLKKQDFTITSSKQRSSREIKKHVEQAIQIQHHRFGLNIQNGKVSPPIQKRYLKLDNECVHLLSSLVEKGKLTGRSFDKIARVAQTIADLNGHTYITKDHCLEALMYRKIGF